MKEIILILLVASTLAVNVRYLAKFRHLKSHFRSKAFEDYLKESWFFIKMTSPLSTTGNPYTEMDISAFQRGYVWLETLGLVVEPMNIQGKVIEPVSSFGGGAKSMPAADESFDLFNKYSAYYHYLQTLPADPNTKDKDAKGKEDAFYQSIFGQGTKAPSSYGDDPTTHTVNGKEVPYADGSFIIPWRLVENCQSITKPNQKLQIPLSYFTKEEQSIAKLAEIFPITPELANIKDQKTLDAKIEEKKKADEQKKAQDPNNKQANMQTSEKEKKSIIVDTGIYDMNVFDGGIDYEVDASRKVKYSKVHLAFAPHPFYSEINQEYKWGSCSSLMESISYWIKELITAIFKLSDINKQRIRLNLLKKSLYPRAMSYMKRFEKFMTYISIEGIMPSPDNVKALNIFKNAVSLASQLDSIDPYAESFPFEFAKENGKIDELFSPLQVFLGKKNPGDAVNIADIFTKFQFLGTERQVTPVTLETIEADVTKLEK